MGDFDETQVMKAVPESDERTRVGDAHAYTFQPAAGKGEAEAGGQGRSLRPDDTVFFNSVGVGAAAAPQAAAPQAAAPQAAAQQSPWEPQTPAAQAEATKSTSAQPAGQAAAGSTGSTGATAAPASTASPAPAAAAAAAAPAPASAPSQPGLSLWVIPALVAGLTALVSCWIPLVNNGSFFLGIAGVILSIIALVGISKGKRTGMALAIAAIVISTLAAFMVPIIQTASAPSPTALFNRSVQGATPVNGAVDSSNLAVGQTLKLDNGLSITLNSAEANLANYDGSRVVAINVTYVNHASESAQFSIYDWKGENAAGTQTGDSVYNYAQNKLAQGKLSPGGSVTGNIYLPGDTIKVHYYSDVVHQTESTAAWRLD